MRPDLKGLAAGRLLPVERRRLRDGSRALRLPEPRTPGAARRQIDVLLDGARALQSLDDLGSPAANKRAWRAMEWLLRKADRLRRKAGRAPSERELDSKVAALVMGARGNGIPPAYSSDVGLAMRVLDRMRSLGHRWLVNADENGLHLRRVACVVRDWERDEKRYVADRPLGWSRTLDGFARAVCEAAVREVGRKR